MEPEIFSRSLVAPDEKEISDLIQKIEGVITTHYKGSDYPEISYRQLIFYSRALKDAELILQHSYTKKLLISLFGFQYPFYNFNMEEFLTSFTKEGFQKDNLSAYTIMRDLDEGNSRLFGDTLYYDAPYSFVMRYDNQPIACTSFKPVDGAILIPQI